MVRFLVTVACFVLPSSALAADWPMGGRDSTRNPVSPEKNAPIDWQVKTDKKAARNIRWSTRVGTHANGGPIVANGLVWVGTNNEDPLDPKVTGDRGVLACFRESDGKFLYQYTSPRLKLGMIADWPAHPLSGSPVTEADKLWFITNRREVVCLDVGPLIRGHDPAKELWKYDLVKQEGVFPNSPMIPDHNNDGSPAIYKELLFVPTGNGVDMDHPRATRVRAPNAPSLVCLLKESGKVVWRDNSAGKECNGGDHASPLLVEIGGQVQVIHPQADGWVRSFNATNGKLLWRFDVNRKGAKWDYPNGDGKSKHVVMATPVFAEGRVYFAVGREPEFTTGPGQLFCIDPSKRGDISPELDDGKGQGKPNPNSGLIWEFTKDSKNPSVAFFGQTDGCVAIRNGLLVVSDRPGAVFCLDAVSGRHYWTHVTESQLYADPLIVDRRIFVASDDGIVTILDLSKSLRIVATNHMNQTTEASPVFANGALYILARQQLFAIGASH